MDKIEADIKIERVLEQQLKWIPLGYHHSNALTVLIRNGVIIDMTPIKKEIVRDDIDGLIEFLLTIRKFMAENQIVDAKQGELVG